MYETSSKRDVTDYLRGFGIMAVIITHYSGEYSPDFYSHYLSEYGNAPRRIWSLLFF